MEGSFHQSLAVRSKALRSTSEGHPQQRERGRRELVTVKNDGPCREMASGDKILWSPQEIIVQTTQGEAELESRQDKQKEEPERKGAWTTTPARSQQR